MGQQKQSANGAPGTLPARTQWYDMDEVFQDELSKKMGGDLKFKNINIYEGDNLQKIHEAQLEAFNKIMSYDLIQKNMMHTEQTAQSAKLKKVLGDMKQFNEFTCQYQVKSNGRMLTLDDLVSSMIATKLSKIQQMAGTRKYFEYYPKKMKVNLYSFVVTSQDGSVQLLAKAQHDQRIERTRPEDHVKHIEQSLIPRNNGDGGQQPFFYKRFEYSRKWFELSEKKFPSIVEVLDGLVDWFQQMHVNTMEHGTSLQVQHQNKLVLKETFYELCAQLNLTNLEDLLSNDQEVVDFEKGLWNPYAKFTCFILQLFTMELGHPPLYAELTKQMVNQDMTHHGSLGPYAFCLCVILNKAENKRSVDDRMMAGKDLERTLNGCVSTMATSFLLFRGTQMKEDLIKSYTLKYAKDNVDGFDNPLFVHFPGMTNFTQELAISLDYAFKPHQADTVPVLFVVSYHNFFYIRAVLLNSEAHTAYPNEGVDFLMREGNDAFILDVERDHLIDNAQSSWQKYNGKMINVIHLYMYF